MLFKQRQNLGIGNLYTILYTDIFIHVVKITVLVKTVVLLVDNSRIDIDVKGEYFVSKHNIICGFPVGFILP